MPHEAFCQHLGDEGKKAPPSKLHLAVSTKRNLLRVHLGPTAQIYCDGVATFLEILDVFFVVRGKIPATSRSLISQNGAMGKDTLFMEKLISVCACVI